MSKKDLMKPIPKRQPTSDEIDSFVRRGAGKDTETKKSANTDIKTPFPKRQPTSSSRNRTLNCGLTT